MLKDLKIICEKALKEVKKERKNDLEFDGFWDLFEDDLCGVLCRIEELEE